MLVRHDIEMLSTFTFYLQSKLAYISDTSLLNMPSFLIITIQFLFYVSPTHKIQCSRLTSAVHTKCGC